jgi:pSer/pThr/pTyr-binding forkhead associated (FHA) protein
MPRTPKRLRVLFPDKRVRVYYNLRPYLLIGRKTNKVREQDIDLSPYDTRVKGVSRYHAKIMPNDIHGLVLIDLTSANGTSLGGQRLQPHRNYPLNDGDSIKIGNLRIQIFFEFD